MMLAMITQHLVHAVQRWELPLPRVFVPRALLASGSSPWAVEAEAEEAKAKWGAEDGLGAEDDANLTTARLAEAGLAAALEAEGAAEGPVLHDAEALEDEGAADTPKGAPDPGDIGASAGRSCKNGGGRG